jgi:MFS transporter (putative signal transducer)
MVTALVLQGVVGYFRHSGLDLAQLSWLSLTMLPWVGKFLWAPWAERHTLSLRGNRYLGSLVSLQLSMALLMACISLLSPTHSVGLIVLALTLLSALSSSHGIYANGIAICTTNERSRPLANAAQVGGSYLGIPFGSFAFLVIAQHAGWQGGFLGMAVLSLLLLLPPLLLRQPTQAAASRERPSLDLHGLCELWPTLALTAVYCLAMRGLMGLQTVLLVDKGLSLTALGEATTLYSTAASGLGILLGGWMTRRMGAWRSLLPVMVLHATLACILAVGYPQFDLSAWLGLFGLLNVAAAIGFVTLYNVLMGLVRPHQPASDYALFQSTDMAIAMLASMAALQLAHYMGYQPALTLFALVAIAALWPAHQLCRRLVAAVPATPEILAAHPSQEVGHG